MDTSIFTQIIFMWLTSYCSCQLICPPAEIGSSVELICNYPNQTTTWVKFISPSDAEAFCTPDCSNSTRFIINLVNQTQGRLTVPSVEWQDEGEWECKLDQNGIDRKKCNMNLFKIPSCEISSDTATSNITLGEERNLTLRVTNSYCTENNTFTLQTGNVTYTKTGQARQNISDSFEYLFIVSESHIGPVSAKFECGNELFNLRCDGVTKLESVDPPSCNIRTDRPTNSLEKGDKISLTIFVEKNPCSGVSQVNLNVGEVGIQLSNDTNQPFNTTLEFKLTEDNLGDVNLTYICNAVTRNVACAVVVSERNSRFSFQVVIIGASVGVSVLAILVIVVICCRCKRSKRKTPKVEEQYSDVKDSTRGGNSYYTEVSDIKGIPSKSPRPESKIEMVPNVIYESGDLCKAT